jgi:glycosyltransferase involved in cell wall biosynthesis
MSVAISIVLPVYNQEDHIAAVVQDYRAALAGLPAPYELLLVVNGSRDRSLEICRDLAASCPGVQTLEASPAGWGRAVRVGLAAASGDLLCYTNTARTSGTDLRRLLDIAVAAPDHVVKADRRIRDSLRRRIGSALYNLEARLLHGVTVRDVNGTPKIFPRRFSGLLTLQRDDDLIDLEFCRVCRQRGYRIEQVAVHAAARHGGRSTTRLRSAWRMYRGAWTLT